MRRSKLYKQQREQLGDNQQRYSVLEAIGKLKALPGVKFDQTVEVAIKLGVDTRKSDQTVRGAVPLPRGTGKTVRVAVVADGNAAAEAKEAGADVVGFEDLVQKIKEGFADFDILISTPDAMRLVRPLGRQLGPRGLMPNPKTGTVTDQVGTAVRDDGQRFKDFSDCLEEFALAGVSLFYVSVDFLKICICYCHCRYHL